MKVQIFQSKPKRPISKLLQKFIGEKPLDKTVQSHFDTL